jgi:hypothetical protein
MNRFECQCYRLRFTAIDSIRFPAGKGGNVVRGAFGLALRESAPREIYAAIFEPKTAPSSGPSGFTDLPRPFRFRPDFTESLQPGSEWTLGLLLFGSSASYFPYFQAALSQMADSGLGPSRGRLRIEPEVEFAAVSIDLNQPHPAVSGLELEFRTPTELKSGGETISDLAFAPVFARVRDRIATLAALYGPAPIAADFRGLGERAASVRTLRQEISRQHISRRSSRTGQTHPIGGFTGVVEYAGAIAEFVPWLRAGEYAGVGRQTMWGKGEIRIGGLRDVNGGGGVLTDHPIA